MTLADLNAVLLALVLAGVVARRRAADCAAFTVYLACCLLIQRLYVGWPETFFNYGFWLTKEWVYCGLKAAIALELAAAAFKRFPRGRAAAILATAAACAAGAALLLLVDAGAPGYRTSLTVLLPRAQAALVWAYVVLLAAVAWYRIPFDGYARAIVLGFLLYMGAYVGGLEAVRSLGGPGFAFYEALNPAAYAASVAVWGVAAWRPREAAAPVAIAAPATT